MISLFASSFSCPRLFLFCFYFVLFARLFISSPVESTFSGVKFSLFSLLFCLTRFFVYFISFRFVFFFQSPFVVISVVGQELLQAGQYHSAVTVLEAALRIGTCSLKLRGSVFSALSSAYWALNQLDKAINYMQQDLAVAKSLGKTIFSSICLFLFLSLVRSCSNSTHDRRKCFPVSS